MDLFKDSSLRKFIPQKDVISTSILMIVVFIYAIALFYYITDFFNSIKKQITPTFTPENYTSSRNIVYALYFVGFLYISSTIMILALNFTGNTGYVKSLSPYENIIKTQSIVLISGLIVAGLSYYLQGLNKKIVMPSSFNNITIGFNVILVMLIVFRYYQEYNEYETLKNEILIKETSQEILNNFSIAENNKLQEEKRRLQEEAENAITLTKVSKELAGGVGQGVGYISGLGTSIGSSIGSGIYNYFKK